MELDQNHADAISDKGTVLCKKGKYAVAIHFFDTTLSIYDASIGTRVRTLRNKAKALRELRKADDARICDEADRLKTGMAK